MALHLVAPPPGGLYRLGHQPDPFAFRDAPALDEDEPAALLTGNRFDAPNGEYQSLYLASAPYGCFLEKLAAFRHDRTLQQRMRDAVGAGDDPDYPDGPDPAPDPQYDPPLFAMPSMIPAGLFAKKVMGQLQVDPSARFIDIEHEDTLQLLATYVGDTFARDYGVERFDRGVVFSQDRRVTRNLALAAFEASRPQHAIGIKYTSAHAAGVDCWTVWNTGHGALHDPTLMPIDLSNPDLVYAAGVLGLTVPTVPTPPMPPDMPDSW